MKNDLKEKTTFNDVMNDLPNVYKVIGVGDSVVRERVFEELSKRTKKSYNDIYDIWLDDFSIKPKKKFTIPQKKAPTKV